MVRFPVISAGLMYMTIGTCKNNKNPRLRRWTIKDLARVARYVAAHEGVDEVCAAMAREFEGMSSDGKGCKGCKVNCAELKAAALAVEAELDILDPVVTTILEVKDFAEELSEAYKYLVEKTTDLFEWIGVK